MAFISESAKYKKHSTKSRGKSWLDTQLQIRRDYENEHAEMIAEMEIKKLLRIMLDLTDPKTRYSKRKRSK